MKGRGFDAIVIRLHEGTEAAAKAGSPHDWCRLRRWAARLEEVVHHRLDQAVGTLVGRDLTHQQQCLGIEPSGTGQVGEEREGHDAEGRDRHQEVEGDRGRPFVDAYLAHLAEEEDGHVVQGYALEARQHKGP